MVKFTSSILILLSGILLGSCNLVEHAEKIALKKMASNGIEHFTMDADSMHLNGYAGGQGKNVVFIHGFGGDAQLSWKQTLIDFAPHYHVMAADLMWFGKGVSSQPACLRTQVEALTLFINAVTGSDTSTYTLIGHSYGGFVALGTFFNRPERVEKIVIIDSPGITYDTTLLHILEKDAGVDHFTDLFVLEEPDDIERLNRMAFTDPPKIPFFVKNRIYETYFASHHTEFRLLLTTLSSEQQAFLSQETAFPPSLVFWGEKDLVFPASEGKKLAQYMKARYVEIPEVGHSAPFENYPEFKSVLTQFLAE